MKNYNDYDHNNEINVFFAFYKCRFLPRQNYLSIRHYSMNELYTQTTQTHNSILKYSIYTEQSKKKDYYPFDLCSMTYGKHYVVLCDWRGLWSFNAICMLKCHLIKSKSLLF